MQGRHGALNARIAGHQDRTWNLPNARQTRRSHCQDSRPPGSNLGPPECKADTALSLPGLPATRIEPGHPNARKTWWELSLYTLRQLQFLGTVAFEWRMKVSHSPRTAGTLVICSLLLGRRDIFLNKGNSWNSYYCYC
jgi:hypothetical protein